ncbi:MAG: lytic transglycosylase domain-containing protein [Oscillospiraceae bacterium]
MVLFLAVAALVAAFAYSRVEKALYPLTYSEEIERWAAEYEVDPYLVYAIVRTESGFDPEANSSVGARGLMQMTEETFVWIKTKIAPEQALTFEDLYTPTVSIQFGTYYLSLCLQRYENDVSTAAAAYHSGWGTVDTLLASGEYSAGQNVLTDFPYRQMSHYVRKVNNSYAKYLALYT